VSRSGSTLTAGSLRVRRAAAARFSFTQIPVPINLAGLVELRYASASEKAGLFSLLLFFLIKLRSFVVVHSKPKHLIFIWYI